MSSLSVVQETHRGTMNGTNTITNTQQHNNNHNNHTPTQQQPVVMVLGSKPSVVTSSPMRFLVMDAPRQSNLHLYIRECKRQGVTDLVRVCEPTYDGRSDLANAGMTLHEMEYPDGTSPPADILTQWLELVWDRWWSNNTDNHNDNNNNTSQQPQHTIAVHCVAGLGRAPVLVAIALVEFAGMDPVEAVSFLRRHRRGAINEKQLNYLEKYKRQWHRRGNKKKDKGGSGGTPCCVLL